jgi:hypothetical protein
MMEATTGVSLEAFENIGGRDLSCRIRCTCPDPMFADSSVAHLFTRSIRLSGYDDANFWTHVANQWRELSCVCGRVLEYQWTPHGVEYRWKS